MAGTYPSNELLNTTLAEMSSDLIIMSGQNIPLIDKLVKAKQVNKESVGGTYFERPFFAGSPASAKRIIGGAEEADITRRAISSKYQVASARFLLPVAIPNIELERNQGTQGVQKLIKRYPEAALIQAWQDLELWLFTASYNDASVSVFQSGDLDGVMTLNGDYTDAASNTGLLRFEAVGSQTAKFQGVARSNTIRHVNQYGLVTSFATDGMKKIGQAYDQASAFSPRVDLGFADPVSYGNMVEYSADTVRTPSTDTAVFGAETRSYLPYKAARVYYSSNLDTTKTTFTGTALSTSDITGGAVMFLSSEEFEMPFYKLDLASEFKDLSQAQDVSVAKFIWDFNLLCHRPPTCAVVAGTRIP